MLHPVLEANSPETKIVLEMLKIAQSLPKTGQILFGGINVILKTHPLKKNRRIAWSSLFL